MKIPNLYFFGSFGIETVLTVLILFNTVNPIEAYTQFLYISAALGIGLLVLGFFIIIILSAYGTTDKIYQKDRALYEEELKTIHQSLPAAATTFGSTVSFIGLSDIILGVFIAYYSISGSVWLGILIILFMSFFSISKYKNVKRPQKFS